MKFRTIQQYFFSIRYLVSMMHLAIDQGFATHYRAILNMVSHLEVFQCERISWLTVTRKDGLTSFLMLSVLEAKIKFNVIF